MMPGAVLPPVSSVAEGDFHAAMIAGLGRAQIRAGGRKALAYILDITPKALGNIFAGGSTDAKRLWDALVADGDALEDVARLYGKKIVPEAAICTSDSGLSVPAVALLSKAIAAELDGVEDHRELLDMEPELRALRELIDARLVRIATMRRPRVA